MGDSQDSLWVEDSQESGVTLVLPMGTDSQEPGDSQEGPAPETEPVEINDMNLGDWCDLTRGNRDILTDCLRGIEM